MSCQKGIIKEIKEGSYTIDDVIGAIKTQNGIRNITLTQKWSVRKSRPIGKKYNPEIPMQTGQRVIDTFFPIAKGGTCAIPGPFGSGKTITQQSLAKYSDVDIVVYVGCGERGNEMTEVLEEFPALEDPKTKKPLMERTILIANTSNMPVAAREASIYTGATIAEYYRDMGYNVAMMVDSTSRWAEAMREISARLEEMPGEEGYPAYLGRSLAGFYSRAGFVKCACDENRFGSVTIIGAVSPPGGDISEPVSQNTLRVTKVFHSLDATLAHRRHFPAIDWLKSYSLYLDQLKGWYEKNVSSEFIELRNAAMGLLQKEAELQDIVRLVGPDSLPESEQAVLKTAQMLREDFLQQNSFDEVDANTSYDKQYLMLKAIMSFNDSAMRALKAGIPLESILNLKAIEGIGRMKEIPNDRCPEIEKIIGEMDAEFRKLTIGGGEK
jgi:V/A-type H+-transporting ATPase subunit A